MSSSITVCIALLNSEDKRIKGSLSKKLEKKQKRGEKNEQIRDKFLQGFKSGLKKLLFYNLPILFLINFHLQTFLVKSTFSTFVKNKKED